MNNLNVNMTISIMNYFVYSLGFFNLITIDFSHIQLNTMPNILWNCRITEEEWIILSTSEWNPVKLLLVVFGYLKLEHTLKVLKPDASCTKTIDFLINLGKEDEKYGA